VKARIKDIIDLLEFQTEAGQATNRPGQRRMVVSPYPYMIFYRICDDSVIIQRIRHTARRPIGG
jgi:plasmid stabilization system protein ParE